MRYFAVLPLLAALVMPATPPLVAPTPSTVEHVETAPESPRADLVRALEVLHEWDARRARAWQLVDSRALRALYVTGSGAERADLRLLRAYRSRGLVVRRLVTQVFGVRVVRHDTQLIRLRVLDRVAGGEVVQAGHARALPSSRPAARTIVFRLVSGSWRVAGVTGSG
jgi:hypothetical protein